MSKWIAVAVDLPKMGKKVIVSDYRVEGHPEYDNHRITYLTKDCNTQEIKWFNGHSPSVNEFWMILPEPPLKEEIEQQVKEDSIKNTSIRHPHR
jgi:hypothetical protein